MGVVLSGRPVDAVLERRSRAEDFASKSCRGMARPWSGGVCLIRRGGVCVCLIRGCWRAEKLWEAHMKCMRFTRGLLTAFGIPR